MDHERQAAVDISDADQLARLKRASLRSQVVRAVWQLGAVVRRVQREAPHVYPRLSSVVDVLQTLNTELGLEADQAAGCPRDRRQADGGE